MRQCPRCSSNMMFGGEEPSCLACGWSGETRKPTTEDGAGPQPLHRGKVDKSALRQNVQKLFSEAEHLTVREIAESTGVPRRTIEDVVRSLHHGGHIRVCGMSGRARTFRSESKPVV